MLGSVNALGGLVFGFNSGVVAVALPKVNDHWPMSTTMQGLFTASVLIGAALGSLGGGFFCDRFGRKLALIAVGFFGTAGAVCTAFAPNLALMMVSRGVVGLGVGLSTCACPTYVSENAPAHLKGTLGTLFQLAITFGIFVSYLVALPFDSIDHGFQGFRIMFLLGVIPGVLLLIQALTMPESAYWVAMQKKDPLLVNNDVTTGQRKFGGDVSSMTYLPVSRAYMVGVLVAVAQQLTGINAFMFYGPDIFKTAGVDNPIAATIGIGAWNFVTTFASTFLVDRLGRRPLLLIGTFFMAIATVALALVSQLVHTKSVEGPLSIVLLFLFILGFELGEGPLFWVVCTELFDDDMKSSALSNLNVTVWVFNLMLTFGFLPVKNHIGQSGVFWIFGGVGVACVTLMYMFLPETKRVEVMDDARKRTYGAAE